MKKYEYSISPNHKMYIRFLQKIAQYTRRSYLKKEHELSTTHRIEDTGIYFDSYLSGLVKTPLHPDELEFLFSDDRLFSVVRKMTKVEKYTLFYKFLCGLKISEIAHIVGCSEKTIKRAKKSATVKMRGALEKEFIGG